MANQYTPAIQAMIDKATEENDVERIVRTAYQNLKNGVFTEPRWFYDEIAVPADGTIGFSLGDAFKNGEAFPVQLERVLFSIRASNAENTFVTNVDERLIQRVGARFTWHGQQYMDHNFSACPLWQTWPNAATPNLSPSIASHKFFKPWLLTPRDTMRVRVQLLQAPTNQKTATIALHGYGMDTKQPYFKAASVDLTTTVETTLDTSRFRNDGDEPIVMTEMTAHLSADSAANNPMGDVRFLRVQVNQVGNGTSAEWMKRSPLTGVSSLMIAPSVGTCVSRCVVHEFQQPIYWEPGEGLQVEVQELLDLGSVAPVVCVAIAGTLVIG